MNMERRIILIERFAVKVRNDLKNFNSSWNHWLHCRANHISNHSSVQRIKTVDYPNLRRPSFTFTYSFKFTDFCIVHIWTLKKEFCLRKQDTIHSHYTTAIHTTTKHENFSQIYITGGFKKVAHAVRNSLLLTIWSKKL